ncbi:MAG: D-2-hydroxyacid dehydrogenase [Sphaerochaetaceae bacterium]|nr:D-2-hydroxyacid dehydrogenase [Sphaerochaetaceae bacterium]
MKIVILDGYTANPGDLSWKCLEELGELEVYDRTLPQQIPERIRDAHMVLTNDYSLSKRELAGAGNLEYIGVLATGYNGIDLAYTSSRDICVTNVPSYSTHSVAQHTFALILEATNHAGEFSRRVHSGQWVASEDPTFYISSPLSELHDKTLGIIGYGSIGSRVARIARAFGMHIKAHHPRRTGRTLEDGGEYVSLQSLCSSSDIISLHAPLNASSTGIIGKEELKAMRAHTILINTSRGALIDEQALHDALSENSIACACLDVLAEEPMRKDHPLLAMHNCIITPHVAWAPVEARRRLIQIACDNIRNYLNGTPVNVVT